MNMYKKKFLPELVTQNKNIETKELKVWRILEIQCERIVRVVWCQLQSFM